MTSQDNRTGRFLDPMDRARQVSKALSEAARVARFSTRTRNVYSAGGFQARRGAGALRLAFVGSFIAFVAIPVVLCFVYYLFIASDQYVTEARFLVTGGDIPQLDSIGALTGSSSVTVIQDTQIVVNYLGSRAAVEALNKSMDLENLYSKPSIDFLSRFDPKKPIEKFIRYWQTMMSASISMPAGIVELKVRAFSPQEALDITNASLRLGEELVNDMNKRLESDAVRTAEAELERATARLTHARIELEKARNEQGFLDATKAGDAINGLISVSKSELLAMQQEYATRGKQLSVNSPQMKVLKDRIDVTSKQVAELEGKLTSTKQTAESGLTIASSMSRFAELDLEKLIAERLYSGAVASLDVARLSSEQKQIYLNTFVQPSLPQEPQYPKRLTYPSLFGIAILSLWGMIWGLIVLIRNHMA